MQQQTLAIIKPDGVARNLIGEIIGRIEAHGLRIQAMKMIHLSKTQAEAFYAVHRERPFFQSLTDFMSEGPVVSMILSGENAIQVWRDLMGATDPGKAAPLGRFFILLGFVLIILGLILAYSDFFSFLRLGRLPGDIHVKRENFSFYFPITTCILLSVILSLILYFFRK